jgi:putative membrane protein
MKYLEKFLKGIAIGIATLVPGVSGGTMAIIFGVYDDLIHSIGCFFEDWKKHTSLLFQIGLGGLTGILLFSKLLESVLTSYPFVMRFLFIGIICGGLPVLYKKSTVKKRSRVDILFALIGLIIVFLMSAEPSVTTALMTSRDFKSIIFLFVAGLIIAVALVLPGISASFMLLTLGLYSVTLNAINNRDILFLIPLGLGVILGTLATTRTIEKLLQKYPSKVYMLILGFVIGSLIPVFPGIPQGLGLVSSALAFIIGFIIIHLISKAEV